MALTKVTYSMIQGETLNALDYMTPAQIAMVQSGTGDVTVPLQAAINKALATTDSNGNCIALYLPAGRYVITSRLTISGGPGTHRGFGLFGDGISSCIYNSNTSGDHAIVMETALTGGNTEGVYIRNLTIEGNAASGRGISVGTFQGFTRCFMEGLRIVNHGTNAIYGYFDATQSSAQIFITGCYIHNNGLAGNHSQVYFGRVSVFRMLNTQVNTGTKHGLEIGGPIYICDNVAITNSEFNVHTNAGVLMEQPQGTSISGCYSGTSTTNAWIFLRCEGLSMTGCWADDSSANGILIQDSMNISIEGCYIDLNRQTGIALLASSGGQTNYGISIRNCQFIANATNNAYEADIFVGAMQGGDITGNFFRGTTLAGVPIVTNLFAIRLMRAQGVDIKNNSSINHQISTVEINSLVTVFGNYIGPTTGNLAFTDPQLITCSSITDPNLKFANTTVYDMPFAVNPDGTATGRLKLAGPINQRQNWLEDPSTIGGATIQLQLGGLFLLPVATNTAFTVFNPIKWRWGDEFTIIVQNNSGGVMGNITWDTNFKGMAAFVKPTNGKASVATFVVFDGNTVYLKSVINDQ
jgi:parallel beta-helix repeat protein